MDSTRRERLEAEVLVGQRAEACLSFFDDFERIMMARLWNAVQQNDVNGEKSIACVAVTVKNFKEYLQGFVNDGRVAEKELKEEA